MEPGLQPHPRGQSLSPSAAPFEEPITKDASAENAAAGAPRYPQAGVAPPIVNETPSCLIQTGGGFRSRFVLGWFGGSQEAVLEPRSNYAFGFAPV